MNPASGIHAIGMEPASSAFLTDEAVPWHCGQARTAWLQPLLTNILTALAELAPKLGDNT